MVAFFTIPLNAFTSSDALGKDLSGLPNAMKEELILLAV